MNERTKEYRWRKRGKMRERERILKIIEEFELDTNNPKTTQEQILDILKQSNLKEGK